MSSQALPPGKLILSGGQRKHLYVASCIALMTTAMVFSVRAAILDELGAQFHVNKQLVGIFAGQAFLGFAAAILIGGPLCDALGMRALLSAACFLHISGVLLTIFAPSYGVLESATFVVGLGNGLVEGVINPLIATVYAEVKTQKLNTLHAWWPGGLIIGGFAAYALTRLGLGWQIKMATILIPATVYGLMIVGQEFPATERVASGVSASEMFREAIRPMFLLLASCMVLTAATELGPNQWMESVLRNIAHTPGILVLVYISGLMFVMRHFAGAIARKISPIGLMLGCSALAGIGLFALSYAYNAFTAFAAATVFAAGVCYFWPTMLALTSERFPKGGALLLSVMGAIGNIAVDRALPLMGRIYDRYGAAQSFRYVTVAPVVLVLVFGLMFLYYKAHGGYSAVRIQRGIKNQDKQIDPL
ncbi:MAG TPA: MFS transporter [Candidatus Dormibacteraeota bacterium]|nr:MFS transporter [Candidatus Dormibacteraeota bacterium]